MPFQRCTKCGLFGVTLCQRSPQQLPQSAGSSTAPNTEINGNALTDGSTSRTGSRETFKRLITSLICEVLEMKARDTGSSNHYNLELPVIGGQYSTGTTRKGFEQE